MFIKNWKKEILTIPNLLSLLRLALIPVYVTVYMHANEPSHYYLAASILAVSCLTDMVDGKIARRFQMISSLGKILDPVADKATQFTMILCLGFRYPVLWNLIGLFVIKEGFQLVAGGIALKKGYMLEGALPAGKVCTTVLFISLIVLVMLPSLPVQTVDTIAAIDGIFMTLSFANYIHAYFGTKQMLHKISNDET